MLIETKISIAHYEGYQHILTEFRKIYTFLRDERDKKLKIFIEALEQDSMKAMTTMQGERHAVLEEENYFIYFIQLDFAISQVPSSKVYNSESEARKAGELEALFKMRQVFNKNKAVPKLIPVIEYLANTVYYPLLKAHILKYNHLESVDTSYIKKMADLNSRCHDFQEYLLKIRCLEDYLKKINATFQLDLEGGIYEKDVQ